MILFSKAMNLVILDASILYLKISLFLVLFINVKTVILLHICVSAFLLSPFLSVLFIFIYCVLSVSWLHVKYKLDVNESKEEMQHFSGNMRRYL